MESVIGGMPLAMFFFLAGSALACAPDKGESVGQEKCVAFQRDTVPQSLRTAQFIDDHIELVPASEEVYLERESAVVALGRDSGKRFLFLARRPSYPAWRLRNSLRDLVKALKLIDETSPGQNVDAQRAKSAAFAIVSLAQTRVDFAEYVRMDKLRTAPVLDDAARRVASVSLAQMAPALAWFIGCNVDVLGGPK
ncbi:hypothetical protein [Caballeronia sp. M23-90]